MRWRPSDYAMRDAGLPDLNGFDGERAGVSIGSGIGGFGTIENENETLLRRGPKRISPFFIPSSIVNLAAGQVSIRFRARGPNLARARPVRPAVTRWETSYRIIERGDADIMIAGGSEAAITPLAIGGF